MLSHTPTAFTDPCCAFGQNKHTQMILHASALWHPCKVQNSANDTLAGEMMAQGPVEAKMEMHGIDLTGYHPAPRHRPPSPLSPP